MKRKSVVLNLLAAGCLLLLPAGCGERGKLTTGSGAKGPSPKISFEKDAYDFGEVGVNSKRTDEITFTNEGEVSLKITDVKTCCGVSVKLEKTEFAPGETGIMKMEWTAKPQPTTMMWRITVHSNDRAKPEADLTMKATLVNRIAWEPKRLKLFLNEENAGCPKLTVRSLDNRPFSITGLKSTADCISAEYDPSTEATQIVLEPKVDMEKIQENLQGSLKLDLSHPEGRGVTILFDVVPKYTVNPQLLIIFGAAQDKPAVRKIKVLSNFDKALEVKSVSSEDETIIVKMLGKKKILNGYELEVEITPTAPAVEGKTVYTGTFSINLKGGEELSVTCNAYYSKRRT
ncbi:DUF1573 domain-containing protein [Planctomycetota bacterium]